MMAGGAALGGFITGLTQGMEFRNRLRDREDERKQREQDRLWEIEDRNVEANDRARKQKWAEEDRTAAAEERKRRRAIEDEKLAAYRADRKRQQELQGRDDATYFEEQGDKTAAKEAYEAARRAREKDVESGRMDESKAAAGLGILAPVDEQASVLPGSTLERAAMRGITPQAPQQPRIRPDAEEPPLPPIEPYNQEPTGASPRPMDPPAYDFAPPRAGAPAVDPQPPAPATPAQPGLISRLNPFGAANAAEVDPMRAAQRVSAPPPAPSAALSGIPPAAQTAAPRPADPGAAAGETMAADPMRRAQQLSAPGPAVDAVIGAQPPSPGVPPSTPPAALERGAVAPGARPPMQPQPAKLPPQAAVQGITAAPSTPPSVQVAAATAGPRALAAPQAAAAAQGLGLLREPLKPTGDHVADFMTYYQREAVPKIVEHYLSTGRPESAAQFQEWAKGEARKAGMEHWARGVQAASRGDEGTFLDSMIEAYNSDGYFDDGYEIVRKGSSLRKDKAGNTVGATLVFRNQATGEETIRNLDVEDIYETGVLFLAPEQVYEYGVQQRAAAQKQADAVAERRRKAAADAQKALSQDPAYLALSPEEQDAKVADWVARQEAAGDPRLARPVTRSPANWTGDE